MSSSSSLQRNAHSKASKNVFFFSSHCHLSSADLLHSSAVFNSSAMFTTNNSFEPNQERCKQQLVHHVNLPKNPSTALTITHRSRLLPPLVRLRPPLQVSSYQPVLFNSSLCLDLDTSAGGGCNGKPGPGCSNDTCAYFPENPVTGKGGMGLILTDKFALPTAKNPAQFGPVSQIVLSCTFPDKFSTNYRGLAKGSTCLATLGRFNYSLSAQISWGSSAPWIFALCLPSSSNATGIALFNSAGPYNFSPKIDASKLLIHTPLILGPRGSDTQIFYWYKSPDYYIGLTSFRVNGKVVLLNQTLLDIDEKGHGGTKLSTSKPYTVLQSSIFKSLTDAFVKESTAVNLTLVKPLAPFSLCYGAAKIPSTRVGPAVPAIDLVLGNNKVFWRIYGSNSMVRIKNGDVDAWCLGLVDGGDAPKTSIVIGGHHLEDNLVQFDLERERLGFSSSLLLRGTTCANFDLKANQN
ncbi:putative aspartic proteinase GIP1 [Sesamum alatum]|uniref:Aspartic proteinase GIP1 n=1 Tax=Sesamum alatum TaxID=300844 RepID=A0AAE1Z495_9LAMI|nr:putative aspartic proteinase GIP1 [Sesamum alatum]